jgi:hypothetical protein
MRYNTTVNNPTRFLNPTQLIEEGMEEHNVCSENWPYPTEYKIGDVFDSYYAEVWYNGMDWQNTYWFLEQYKADNPVAVPFLIFDDHKNRDNFSEYDFGKLMQMWLIQRKHVVMGLQYDAIFDEEIVHFLAKKGNIPNKQGMFLYRYSHASQPRVEFYLADKNLLSDVHKKDLDWSNGERRPYESAGHR